MPASRSRHEAGSRRRGLLYLCFFEYDVLAGDRVEFFQFELVGFAARILLRDIEEPGICAADQLDQDCIFLGHTRTLGFRGCVDWKITPARLLSRRAQSPGRRRPEPPPRSGWPRS